MMVPVWTLLYVILLSGIFPPLGNAPISSLGFFYSLIVIWGGIAYFVSTRVDAWLAAEAFYKTSTIFILLFALNGAIGGFSFWLFWEEGVISSNLYLCMAMIIILSVHSIELSVYLPAFAGGTISMSVFIFARLISSDSSIANLFAYIVPLLVGSYFYMSVRSQRTLLNHISTRLEKEKLNQDLRKTTNQLKKSLSELEMASEAKDTFFASMSHDLQTPLNAISGFNQALDQQIFGPLNEKQKEYTGYIQQASQHLQSLIRDVLTISALQSGEYEVDCKNMDIRKPIQQAIDILHGAYPNTRAQLTVHMPEAETIAYIDENRFVECVLNLLTNAVKYTPEGAPISLEMDVGTNRHALHIIDSGAGMNEAEISAALKPYSRIKTATVATTSGTGLGLPIVSQLIQKQGGTLKLSAHKEGGMCATLHVIAGDSANNT